VSSRPGYTLYRPGWYRRRPSTLWWLRRRSYTVFILRELSSVFVAWSVVFLLLLVRAVGKSEQAYQDFLHWASRPALIVINVITLAFLVLHSVTWFNLAPKAMVVRLRGQQVPPVMIAASNFFGWAVVSGIVAFLVLRSP